MTAPSCNDVRAHLPLHVGGDLEDPLAEAVRAHVAGCAPCGRALTAARRSREALLIARVEAPEGLDVWPAVAEALALEGRIAAAPRRPRASAAGAPWRRWAAVAGGALAAGVLGLVALGPGSGTAPTPEPGPIRAVGLEPLVYSQGAQDTARGPDAALVPVGLRRAGDGEERLRDGALPVRYLQNPHLNVPIDVGENALVGFGVR